MTEELTEDRLRQAWHLGRKGEWAKLRSHVTFPSRDQVLGLAVQGVRIDEGFFEDSLTPALAEEIGEVSLVHFDADLHSATACALEWVTPLLHSCSVLLFDEFLGEDAAEERALAEWTERTGIPIMLLAMFGRVPDHGRGPVRPGRRGPRRGRACQDRLQERRDRLCPGHPRPRHRDRPEVPGRRVTRRSRRAGRLPARPPGRTADDRFGALFAALYSVPLIIAGSAAPRPRRGRGDPLTLK
jgi:hypothetical protein